MGGRGTGAPYPDCHGARSPPDPDAVEGGRLHQLSARLPFLADRAPAGAAVPPRREGHTRTLGAGGPLLAPLRWRTRPAAAHSELERCWDELQHDDEYQELALDSGQAEAFLADAGTLVDNYFRLEDPNEARAVGIELGVETVVDGMRLRGIIDRLDVADDGRLIVVDYKTGRAPSERYERGSLGGVQTYALLCESLLGRAPAEVRLLYLRQPVAISSAASEQTIRGQRRRAVAVWTAIERACDAEDFRPHVGPLCDHCHFKASCPAFAA